MLKTLHSAKTSKLIVSTLPALLVCFLVMSPVAAAESVPVNLGTVENLSNSPNASTAPVVAAVNNFVYVAWEEKVPGSQHVTYFQTSNNYGVAGSWVMNMSFDMTGGASPQTSAVQIAAEGKYVFLTWEQDNLTAYAISADNGMTFTSGIFTIPSQYTGTMSGEAVSACGAWGYFTWSDIETIGHSRPILFVSAHDTTGNGNFVFSTAKSLSTTSSAHGEDENACSGPYVYAVWDSIYFTRSTNNGVTWSTVKQLKPSGGSGGSLSREPMISASGPNVYVTFPSNATPTGQYETFVVVSNNHGATFALAEDISINFMTNTREVQVLASGANVWITTRGKSMTVGGTQQYVYTSNNNGSTFSAPILAGGSKLPNPENGFGGLAVNGTNVYVQWIHNPPGKNFKGIQQIFLSASQDSGNTFASYQQLSQSTAGTIGYGDPSGGQGPQVAASGSHVYSVWIDLSSNAGDVLFVASTLAS